MIGRLEKAFEERMREIVRQEAARPEFVHQRTVEAIVGIPRRQYLADARAKCFGSMKEGRLVVARTANVIAYYSARIQIAESQTPANAQDAEARDWGRVGARRVP